MAEAPEILYFDLITVHDHFQKALLEDDDIGIKSYLEAYKELFKFFQLMGSVFSFVSSDLKLKIDILQNLYNENQEGYTSIRSMIHYEKEHKLLENGDRVNGARTLLRLHRGLDFILEFLRNLGNVSDSESTSNCCREAYHKTLSKHHPWIVRKAAGVAMYTMPHKKALFKKVCGENFESSIDELPKMLEVITEVLTRTDVLYEKYELHSLP